MSLLINRIEMPFEQAYFLNNFKLFLAQNKIIDYNYNINVY